MAAAAVAAILVVAAAALLAVAATIIRHSKGPNLNITKSITSITKNITIIQSRRKAVGRKSWNGRKNG